MPIRPGTSARRYRAVDDFAKARVGSHGDLFGWELAPDGTAILLVSHSAPADDFPPVIDGIPVRLRRTSEQRLRFTRFLG
jgi:hypothetical protein